MREIPEASRPSDWAHLLQTELGTSVINGWYEAGTKKDPPFIILYAAPIYRPIPSLLWWTTIPTLRIIRTLAHEVAHHLIATRGYVFESGENVADEEALANRFSVKVLETTAAKWSYRLGQWCIRDLAGWYYTFAMTDWRKNDFKAAARRFYSAWDLCPDDEEAAYWYWQAREKCGE